ncbi:eukaryotic translation initiation factor 5-like [Wolffia australiana]
MALQNIGASNRDDAFYRYKMPRMVTKIEGRGNGIKTNVVNMVDIAKALARPASYTTKYFGCELGAQSKFDEKTGVSLVNGAHDTAKLAQLLENFIKKYVQCYGCGNPETEVLITKIQTIQLKCAACGFVSDVDMRDKLTTFILKNPPEPKKGSKDAKKAMRRAEKERLKEGEAADEEQKKLKQQGKKKPAAAPKAVAAAPPKKKEERVSPPASQASDDEPLRHDEEDDEDDDDVQWQTDTSREAAQRRIQEQLNAVTAEMVMLATDEPEKKKKSKVANGHHATEEEQLVKKLKAKLQEGGTPEETRALAGNPTAETMAVLLSAALGGAGKGMLSKEAGKWVQHLAAAAGQDEAGQICLLQGLERFVAGAGPEAVKEVALVLKLLYDEDVVEEEVVVAWFDAGALKAPAAASQFWKNVKPFVEWLRNAESESE